MKKDTPKACTDVSFPYNQDEYGAHRSILIGTAEWFSWLKQQCCFTFGALDGLFTVRKEQRHGNWYWYAYQLSQEKLHVLCLGKTEELTLARLYEAAQKLRSFSASLGVSQAITSTPETEIPEPLAQPFLKKEIPRIITHETYANRRPPVETLSEREWEIIQLVITAKSNLEIARHLTIAETTVKWHLKNIFSKLRVCNRTQLIALAYKLKWC